MYQFLLQNVFLELLSHLATKFLSLCGNLKFKIQNLK